MQRLIKLDKELSSLFADFNDIANELEMKDICDLSDEATIAQQSYAGIYRIDVSTAGSSAEVAEWIKAFQVEWEHEAYLKKSTPSLIKKRISKHKQLSEWMPLYLGKAEKVGERVLGHINGKLNTTTYALKLKARVNMNNKKFRLLTLAVPVTNYGLIVPTLESALRDRFHPILGKQ